MSDILIPLAQFLVMMWPVIILATAIVSLKGRGKLPAALKRIQRSLLIIWTLLAILWVVILIIGAAVPTLLPEPINTGLFFSGLAVLLGTFFYPIIRQRAKLTHTLLDTESIRELNLLTPVEFEKLTAETYRALGYRVKHMGKTGDHGVDLEVWTPEGEYWVVQCKRWRDSVGEATVRELYGTMHHENANRAVLVTSAEITFQAEVWAKGKPIDLVDGRNFLRLMRQARHKTRIGFWRQWLNKIKSGMVKKTAAPLRCPNCGVRMIPRPQNTFSRPGRKLYRCLNYPDCRVVIERK